jgi:ribosomal protein S27E
VQEEFDAYLKCGRLEERFLRVRCGNCHAEKLLAFSCKKRGFCPSCGGRRMAETAALLADEVLPERPLRQWVLSLPFALRYLLARDPDSLTLVLRTVYRAISGWLLQNAGLTRATGHTGAVTLIQRFGSALNLNIHFHMIVLDGVFVPVEARLRCSVTCLRQRPPSLRHWCSRSPRASAGCSNSVASSSATWRTPGFPRREPKVHWMI